MQFVIVLEGEPPVDLLSKLSKVLSPMDREARVHTISERTTVDMETGDALVRVRVPNNDGARTISVKAGGKLAAYCGSARPAATTTADLRDSCARVVMPLRIQTRVPAVRRGFTLRTRSRMALSGDPHQAAAFLDQALAAFGAERLNGRGLSGGRGEDDELDYGGVDPLIRPFVSALRYHGINTYMSCQGGTWHPDRLPWIAFGGDYRSAGRVAMWADHYSWPAVYLDRRFFLQGGNMGHTAWVLIFSGIDERDAADAEARLNHAMGAVADTTTHHPNPNSCEPSRCRCPHDACRGVR